jgi:hypothetical protein
VVRLVAADGVPLPAGTLDTLALLLDRPALEAFVDQQVLGNGPRFSEVAASVAADAPTLSEVGGRAKALDQRDRTAVGLVGLQTGLSEQVARDHAVHHLQHGRHQLGPRGQQ